MKFGFRGGIHPPARKELAAAGEIERLRELAFVVIPMAQHIGGACTPCVKPGDHVKIGDKIGDGEGLCVPVHASVSGVVTAVEPRPHTNGSKVMAVVIENDRKDACAEAKPLDFEKADAAAIMAAIREAGIVGMGGATFPTGVKISSGLGKVDTVIVNACECEPYITADDQLLRADAQRVLRGLAVVSKALSPTRMVVALENNKPEAIAAVRAALSSCPGAEVAVLPTRYPQGAEKQLIQSVTGREVPGGKLPADVGCAVFNAATLAAVSDAIFEGEPLTERIVTVTGEAVRKPQNFLVPIGAPFSDVIEAAGGLLETADKVISGGPMMGVSQQDLSAPVIKGTNAILCLPRLKISVEDPTCIRCGKCLEVCPMKLQPLYLAQSVRCERFERIEALHLTDCIECGCCSYICPAKIPLVEIFRDGKKTLKERSAQSK